jgi:hypothetical protein
MLDMYWVAVNLLIVLQGEAGTREALSLTPLSG